MQARTRLGWCSACQGEAADETLICKVELGLATNRRAVSVTGLQHFGQHDQVTQIANCEAWNETLAIGRIFHHLRMSAELPLVNSLRNLLGRRNAAARQCR